jgi:hypothetical protein
MENDEPEQEQEYVPRKEYLRRQRLKERHALSNRVYRLKQKVPQEYQEDLEDWLKNLHPETKEVLLISLLEKGVEKVLTKSKKKK